MIFAARLKVDLLIEPTHGPVDLPSQLAVEVGGEVEGAAVTAFAGVFGRKTIFGNGGDGGGVTAADGAVNAHGAVLFALFGGAFLSTERVENIKDLFALFQSFDDVFGILS